MNVNIQSITVRKTIKASRQNVFNAFSRSDALSKWFTPSADISIEVLEFNFVPQGRFRIRYEMPDGTCPTVGGTYETIEPPTTLSFSWMWEEPDIHANIPTHVFIRFLEKYGFTELLLVHDQLPNKEARVRHALGWEGNLERLSQYIIPGT